jgi:predicted lipoprotein with Yx(FWY)xxD motif
MPVRWLAPAGLAALALAVAACGGTAKPGAAAGSAPPSGAQASGAAGTTLKTATIAGVKVLTNSKGFTLYWFAPDTPTTSKCNKGCASFWPPVPAPATAGPGVTGTIGAIKRSDGSMQATYDGHPLYTYKGDNAPGQANGNGLNIQGGVWHEMTASGTMAQAPPSSSPASPGSGGNGYGY